MERIVWTIFFVLLIGGGGWWVARSWMMANRSQQPSQLSLPVFVTYTPTSALDDGNAAEVGATPAVAVTMTMTVTEEVTASFTVEPTGVVTVTVMP